MPKSRFLEQNSCFLPSCNKSGLFADFLASTLVQLIEDWGLRTEDWGLRIEDWGLRIEDWGLRIEKWGPRIEDWELRIEEWGLGTASHLLGPPSSWLIAHTSSLIPQSSVLSLYSLWNQKILKNPQKLKKSSLAANQLTTPCATLHTMCKIKYCLKVHIVCTIVHCV